MHNLYVMISGCVDSHDRGEDGGAVERHGAGPGCVQEVHAGAGRAAGEDPGQQAGTGRELQDLVAVPGQEMKLSISEISTMENGRDGMGLVWVIRFYGPFLLGSALLINYRYGQATLASHTRALLRGRPGLEHQPAEQDSGRRHLAGHLQVLLPDSPAAVSADEQGAARLERRGRAQAGTHQGHQHPQADQNPPRADQSQDPAQEM